MEQELRLPHNGKEGFLYGSVICIITVIIMVTINIGANFGGLTKEAWKAIWSCVPVVWVIALLLESLLIGKIADRLVRKFSEPSDGFNAKILFNILFCVTGMSASMTIIGGMLGTGLSMEPILQFPEHWPRNFFCAFWCEILLAQPAARQVMRQMHLCQIRKQEEHA